jgi:hypothetical protein
MDKKDSNNLFSELNKKGKIYFLFLFFLTFFAFFLDLIAYRILKSEGNFFIEILIKYIFYYFTNQTILFILLILASFFLKIRNKKKYSFFIFASVVDILLTFFIYNLFLGTIWDEKKSDFFAFFYNLKKQPFLILDFVSWKKDLFIFSIFQHFLIPILYFIFFLFYIPFSFKKIKQIFYTFLHPIIYLSFFYIFLFFFSNFCLINKNDIKKCLLPYPSIQCPYHGYIFNEINIFNLNKETKIFVLFRILILFFIFSFFFILVFISKNKFNERKFNNNKNY